MITGKFLVGRSFCMLDSLISVDAESLFKESVDHNMRNITPTKSFKDNFAGEI